MANHYEDCVSLKDLAERELGAFVHAVTDTYGFGQAMISADDWINELESLEAVPALTKRDLRLITIAAAARLAGRLMAFGKPTALTELNTVLV